MYRQKILFALFLIHSCSALQNTFIAFIPGFNSPLAIAITPNGNYAYVSEGGGSQSLLVIDTNQSSPTWNTLISAPNLSGIFSDPTALAITPNSNFAYVCDAGSNSVFVIDTNPLSPTFNSPISAPNLTGTFNAPNGIAITADGLRAYVTNSGNNSVSLVDIDPASTTYNSIVLTLNAITSSPFEIAITPDGNYAYISNLNGVMNVIDTNPASSSYNTLLTTPGLDAVNPQSEGFGITANGFFAYVTDGSGFDVTVIDTNPASPTFNTIIAAPNLSAAFNAPNGVATTADGNYAYVTNFLGTSGNISSVSVINTNPASPTFNSTLSTPGLSLPGIVRFIGLAATPNAQYIYAIDGYNNTVDVIYTGILAAPLNFTGCKIKNIFLTQVDNINRLTWSAPVLGNAPAAYNIYRDAGLTQFIASVPASGTLRYDDHNRVPGVSYTYYIASADSSGNFSATASTTVTQSC